MPRTYRRLASRTTPTQKSSKDLSAYELASLRHMKAQGRAARLGLVLTAITTGALIYIAFLQYKTADSQVRLEYAKVSPIFSVTASPMVTDHSMAVPNDFPKSVDFKISRGEVKISSAEVAQDFRVTVSNLLKDNRRQQSTCIVRSSDYLKLRDDLSGADANQIFSKIAEHPVFAYPDTRVFYVISPIRTWVKIEYIDIFGNKRPVVFSGSLGKLEQTLGDGFGNETGYSLFSATGNNRQSDFPALWQKPIDPDLNDDCKRLISSSLFRSY